MGKGLLLCGATVLLWALYAVYARFAASVWAVDPLVFGSLASLAAGAGLLAAGGVTDGAGSGRAALRDPHTWAYGLLDVLATTLIVGACLFASATELVLLLRIDVIYGLAIAWLLFGRRMRPADLLGVAAIAGGCAITLARMAPQDAAWAAGLIALGSLARAAATAIAERHPATAAADSVRRRCRTTGTIMLASALLYLAVVGAAAVARAVVPGAATLPLPAGSGFADPVTLLAAAGLGLLIYAPATYCYFQASRVAGTETFLMTLVYQPFVTIGAERLLAAVAPLPPVAVEGRLLAAMLAVAGGSTVMLVARRGRPPGADGVAGRTASRYAPRMRWRTPLGGLAILVGLAAYVAAAATLGGVLPDHAVVQVLFYAVAGLLWIPPAVWVIGWAKRDDTAADGGRRR